MRRRVVFFLIILYTIGKLNITDQIEIDVVVRRAKKKAATT